MMRKYDNEFKQQAVKKILDGQSVASVSRELGVAEGILHKWKKSKIESSSDLEKEVLELKKKLREVEMEHDILKQAAIYASSAEEVSQIPVHWKSKSGISDQTVVSGDEG